MNTKLRDKIDDIITNVEKSVAKSSQRPQERTFNFHSTVTSFRQVAQSQDEERVASKHLQLKELQVTVAQQKRRRAKLEE